MGSNLIDSSEGQRLVVVHIGVKRLHDPTHGTQLSSRYLTFAYV